MGIAFGPNEWMICLVGSVFWWCVICQVDFWPVTWGTFGQFNGRSLFLLTFLCALLLAISLRNPAYAAFSLFATFNALAVYVKYFLG